MKLEDGIDTSFLSSWLKNTDPCFLLQAGFQAEITTSNKWKPNMTQTRRFSIPMQGEQERRFLSSCYAAGQKGLCHMRLCGRTFAGDSYTCPRQNDVLSHNKSTIKERIIWRFLCGDGNALSGGGRSWLYCHCVFSWRFIHKGKKYILMHDGTQFDKFF